MAKQMTQAQFKSYLAEFFRWSGSEPKAKESWLVSLESWAQMRYSNVVDGTEKG